METKLDIPISKHSREEKSFKELTSDFFQSTSIHGPAYLTGSNLVTKVFWIVALVAGYTLAGYYIRDSIIDWNENPVLISFEELEKPIKEIKVIPAPNKIYRINHTEIFFGHFSFQQSPFAQQEYSKPILLVLWRNI